MSRSTDQDVGSHIFRDAVVDVDGDEDGGGLERCNDWHRTWFRREDGRKTTDDELLDGGYGPEGCKVGLVETERPHQSDGSTKPRSQARALTTTLAEGGKWHDLSLKTLLRQETVSIDGQSSTVGGNREEWDESVVFLKQAFRRRQEKEVSMVLR
ncbi:hypothetical protein BY996DRAFT_6520981 [Phakopsora pachyrhizi]|nr:hypothetical protein BY996DRAFT_6520981 [Phakopsora pachyrhizi]